jgi:serine/threonine-protein kinase
MITDNGDVKVMDFGIARALADTGATMTSTWNIIGTAQYLSPEQATGTQADARSDLYSVGCLLYELLAGRPPFTGDTPVAIAYQHVSAPLVPITEIQESLDPALNAFFSIALAKDANERYQSANAMLKDLKKLVKGEGITTQIPKQMRKEKARNRIAALSIALVLLVGGVSYFILSPNQSSVTRVLPNVVGLTEAQARQELAGLTITIQRAPDPRIPRDRVSSQLPLATIRVSDGSAVTLTISDGPGDAIVPTGLLGKPLEEVRAALTAAGLRVSRTIAIDSEQEPGIVLKITPEPGSTVEAGTGVVLEIASGNISVPSLVGRTEIEARTILTQAGFLVKIVEAYDANQVIGSVLAQAPSAGEVKLIGSSVTITINKTQG